MKSLSPRTLLTMAIFMSLAACASTFSNKEGSRMSVEETKQALVGEWFSLAPEIRPSATKNPDGSLRPFYLSRQFKYLGDDRFELTIANSADPYGKVPVARIYLRGHMLWKGDHPIAPGAQKVDFVADEDYQVTPLAQPFADLLNKVASAGYAKWEVNVPQKIFGKSFAPFGLAEGRVHATSTAAASTRKRIARPTCRFHSRAKRSDCTSRGCFSSSDTESAVF